MHLLQNEFIKQLSMVVLGTLLFMANCAFILIPSALGSTPGRPPLAQEMAAAPATQPVAVGRMAMNEDEARLN